MFSSCMSTFIDCRVKYYWIMWQSHNSWPQISCCIFFQLQELEHTENPISVVFDFKVARPAPKIAGAKMGPGCPSMQVSWGRGLCWPSPLVPGALCKGSGWTCKSKLYRRVTEVALQILEDFQQPKSASFPSTAVTVTSEGFQWGQVVIHLHPAHVPRMFLFNYTERYSSVLRQLNFSHLHYCI
jgi:hypothetical protein